MVSEFVSREEFDDLKDKHNSLVGMLDELGLKQQVDFSEFEVFGEVVQDEGNVEESNLDEPLAF